MSAMPQDALGPHLDGMLGFITQQTGASPEALEPVTNTVRAVKHSYSFVVEPDFDRALNWLIRHGNAEWDDVDTPT